MVEFLTLDIGGVTLAVIFGVLFLFFGMALGAFFVLSMITFLVLSASVTYIGARYKRRFGLGQEPRGIKNVLANGTPPMIMAVLFYISSISHNGTFALLCAIGFIASVAGITADKFGSEIGVLNGTPRMIFTMKKVKKGTSGGISLLGIFAGLVGAFLMASLVMLVIFQLGAFNSSYVFGIRKAIVTITLGGVIGSLVDSALGYYEERGIGNKFTSNFVCGIIAGFLAIALFMII
jgi:uncharacterized protein (TIGR00297 family)